MSMGGGRRSKGKSYKLTGTVKSKGTVNKSRKTVTKSKSVDLSKVPF